MSRRLFLTALQLQEILAVDPFAAVDRAAAERAAAEKAAAEKAAAAAIAATPV